MSTQSLASAKSVSLRAIRAQTLQLFDLVTSEEVLRTEPVSGFRPLLWHLAHIGVFQNYWILRRCAGLPSMNPTYDLHFDPIKTPREEAQRLPDRQEILAYLNRTLELVEEFLARADFDAQPRDGVISPAYAVELVLEHERQHQETVAFVMQALPYSSKKSGPAPITGKRRTAATEVLVQVSRAPVGAPGTSFAYDNEQPQHWVDLKPFFIDRDLTTNAEYAEFVEAGGYARRELWSDEGWRWKESARVIAPSYWSGPPWRERGFFAETTLREDAPVTGVSWHEAQAYAMFRGKRLPSEFEWEVAAAFDPSSDRMHRFPGGDQLPKPGREESARDGWGTTPVGSRSDGDSSLGTHDCSGNLWQWTSSQFRGYSGFAAYPYPEYSQLWFDGDHYVLRGSSWFSAPALARTSFRNFYRRHFRLGFFGIRCARDC